VQLGTEILELLRRGELRGHVKALDRAETDLWGWVSRGARKEEVRGLIDKLLGFRYDDSETGGEDEIQAAGEQEGGEKEFGSIEAQKLALTLLQAAAEKWGWSEERTELLEGFRTGFVHADADGGRERLSIGDKNGRAMIQELALEIMVPGEDDEGEEEEDMMEGEIGEGIAGRGRGRGRGRRGRTGARGRGRGRARGRARGRGFAFY
jgi:hypothetical protein